MRVLIAITTLALFASAAPAGVGPKARFKKSPRAPKVGQLVKLDASKSKCKRCRYRWHQMRHGKPHRIGKGKVLRHRFANPGVKRLRLTVINRGGRKDRSFKRIRIRRVRAPRAPAPGNPALPPLGRPSCVPGAQPVTSASAARQALRSGRSICITASVGNLDLDGLSGGMRYVGTTGGGAIDEIHLEESSNLTLRARFISIIVRRSNQIVIEQSRIGGTPTNRTMDQLIFIPERSDDVTIRDNDIGWTTADNSGNTGYGIRAYNDSVRLRIERNYIHHIGGDAIQIGMDGPDTLIDRNEVAYAAKQPGSNEHSDDLQIVGHGPRMRVTNNYFHHCGWVTANGPQTGCNSMAIHAGQTNSLLYENNLESYALGLPFIGDLGTGGCNRSNAVFRRNTWYTNGTQFTGGPDLTFALCGGSNNLWERNLVNATFINKYGFSDSGTTARSNLVGRYAIDPATGNCTAAACNPAGGPIGYRKPSGVHW
jgi:hypothetical protein